VTETYEELKRLFDSERRAVVATIVRTKGSTPREVGARMIVEEDGSSRGTVGGGCGEAEVWSEAMEVFETGRPKVIEVDLLHDHDTEGGRACGGLMYVFIEPLRYHGSELGRSTDSVQFSGRDVRQSGDSSSIPG
jgi:xanthine dehydrogenase accessory factor